MYEIYVKERFDAAHFLPKCKTKCANLHGHSWMVEVAIKSDSLNDGMVIDFDEVSVILRDLLPDHCLLNDIIDNPTAENLAKYLFGKIKEKFSQVIKVTVWESGNAGAAYFED